MRTASAGGFNDDSKFKYGYLKNGYGKKMGFEKEIFRNIFTSKLHSMYREIWRKVHSSVAQVNFFTHDNINILSLSGFKVGNYLVTDEYVCKVSHYDHVEIKFVGKDGITPSAKEKFSKADFEKRLVVGSNDKPQNIVLIKIDIAVFSNIPGLSLCDDCDTEIGEPIATVGYKLNHPNLSINKGILSSFYPSQGVRYLQIDANIKQGNAGSPVIRAENGRVIGIIGHKLTEVSQSYKKLKDIINNNIQLLKSYQGRSSLDDIDPVQVLIASQNQIKYVTKEIYRSTNMGVGYALPARQIGHFFKENLILESYQSSRDIIAGF